MSRQANTIRANFHGKSSSCARTRGIFDSAEKMLLTGWPMLHVEQ